MPAVFALAVLSACSGAAPGSLGWSIAVDGDADAIEGTARILAEIYVTESSDSPQDCPTLGKLEYRAYVAREGSVLSPPTLDRGSFCFVAQAFDSECRATSERETVNVPLPETGTLSVTIRVFVPPAGAAVACDECDGGECPLSADAGSDAVGDV